MTLTEAAPLVATCVGVWAVVNAVVTSVAAINERRDVVITGCLGGTPLTPQHRRLIMTVDCLVMTIGMVLLLIGIGLFVYYLPAMIGGFSDGADPIKKIGLGDNVKLAMRVVGIGFMIWAVWWAVSGVFEYRAMRTAIGNDHVPISEAIGSL
jgi:hypothetical protein